MASSAKSVSCLIVYPWWNTRCPNSLWLQPENGSAWTDGNSSHHSRLILSSLNLVFFRYFDHMLSKLICYRRKSVREKTTNGSSISFLMNGCSLIVWAIFLMISGILNDIGKISNNKPEIRRLRFYFLVWWFWIIWCKYRNFRSSTTVSRMNTMSKHCLRWDAEIVIFFFNSCIIYYVPRMHQAN